MRFLNFTLRGFRQPNELIDDSIGKLEREVLDAIWHLGDASVKDVQLRLGDTYAYTTLMTTLDRLFKKGLLTRRKDGRAFFYSQALSRRELENGIVSGIVDSLLGGQTTDAEPILACIVNAVSKRDKELLSELERLVREKKKDHGVN